MQTLNHYHRKVVLAKSMRSMILKHMPLASLLQMPHHIYSKNKRICHRQALTTLINVVKVKHCREREQLNGGHVRPVATPSAEMHVVHLLNRLKRHLRRLIKGNIGEIWATGRMIVRPMKMI